MSPRLLLPADSGSAGAQLSWRTGNLRELNNKLARTITAWEDGSLREGEKFIRTLRDLETTKLRATDGFPQTFGMPYNATFTQLSCIDEDTTADKELSVIIDHLTTIPNGPIKHELRKVILYNLKDAKKCKDALEALLGA